MKNSEVEEMESKCPLVDGDFFPIPTLRSLAFQCLVLNSWPVEEFLPGEGYQDDASNLRVLTGDCGGEYIMTRFEESFVSGDGSEGTEVDKKNVRSVEHTNVGDTVRVVKSSQKKWEIEGLIDFVPAGGLRRVFYWEEDDGAVSEITHQQWIEGSSLVSHIFKKLEDDGRSEGNFGVDNRVVVTFYQGKFIFKERVAHYRKCTRCRSCSYVYTVEASFSKT